MPALENERNAAEDAIPARDFDRLYTAACDTDDDERRTENRLIVMGTGRLTFRSGELLHLRGPWVDRERKIIKIPYHEGCRCTYCWNRAEALAEDSDDLEPEDAIKLYWQPKTEVSARAIYYGFSERAIDAVETFLDETGQLDVAQSTINRRVDRLARRAGIRGNLYPHALRASAAFYWAEQGLESHYLQGLFGWKDLRVARAYIRATGQQLARRIQSLPDTLDKPAEPTTSIPDAEETVDAVKDVAGRYEPGINDGRTQRSLGSYAGD